MWGMTFCHLVWPHPVHSAKQDCSSGAPDVLGACFTVSLPEDRGGSVKSSLVGLKAQSRCSYPAPPLISSLRGFPLGVPASMKAGRAGVNQKSCVGSASNACPAKPASSNRWGHWCPERALSFPQTSLRTEHDAGPSVGCRDTGASVLVLRECFWWRKWHKYTNN